MNPTPIRLALVLTVCLTMFTQGAFADTGSLTQYVEDLQNLPNISDCDRQLIAIKLRLAAMLDNKEDEIKAFASTLPRSTNFTRTNLGPIFVREPLTQRTPRAGWQDNRYSWTGIAALANAVQNQPMGQAWISLDAEVRAILVDDKNRLVNKRNMELSRHDYAVAAGAAEAIAQCESDRTCMVPDFSPEAATLIATNPQYRTFGAGRASLSALKAAIDADTIGKVQRRNADVLMLSNGDIVLPLDPGPFADVKDQLAAYITTVWQSPTHRLQIEWTTTATNPSAYKFVLDAGTSGRSFVNYETRTIHLFPDVRARSIAHEVGHTLGFPDDYYTTWHPETCSYANEYNEEKLMSDPTAGRVTDEEWLTLERIYPQLQN